MVSCMMRQTDEKHILGTAATEILLWSSRRDLIAVSNSSGEVFLRRLSWNKVWKLAKRGDGIKVTAIVWRPDSVVLAVGYSSGHVVLVEVESGETIHTLNPSNVQITSLAWENSCSTLDQETVNFMQDKILPRPPSKMDGTLNDGAAPEDSKTRRHEEVLSLLWIGLENGTVHAYAFGLFPCCMLDLSDLVGEGASVGPVRRICPNYDHSQVSMLTELPGRSSEALLVNVETPLICHCLKELYILGVLYREISALTECLTGAQKALHEAWEDALVDLESKMARYESNGENRSLSVDLMELLMFGHAGMKLEKFLVTDLTDKGLKRIGQAVELSYANMQKLLVKHITCANYQLSHLLTQLSGLAKQEDRFSSLGLRAEACLAAYRAAGSFTAKTAELQQVIDGSVKYLKTFFRWLYVTILRLSDEPVPPELASSTQQDIRFIANFLAKDFETDGRVRLDRVGQYLRNEPLTFVTASKNRPWDMLVEACPSLAALQDSSLFQPRADRSLAQEFAHLEAQIAASFQAIPSAVGQAATLPFQIGIHVDCPANQMGRVRITSRSLNGSKDKSILLALANSTCPARGFYLFEFAPDQKKSHANPRAAFFSLGKCGHLPPSSEGYQLNDIEFYNDEILSVLISAKESGGVNLFLQLSLNLLREELLPVVSRRGPFNTPDVFVPSVLSQSNLRSVDVGSQIEPSSFRILTDFQASTMGLSSSRKVAAIFSAAKRKIRIFDMEVEDEEEEEEEEVDQDLEEEPSNLTQGTVKGEISDVDMAVSP